MLTKDEIIATMSAQGLRITDQRKTLPRYFPRMKGICPPKTFMNIWVRSTVDLALIQFIVICV